jgi:hypothetical protein
MHVHESWQFLGGWWCIFHCGSSSPCGSTSLTAIGSTPGSTVKPETIRRVIRVESVRTTRTPETRVLASVQAEATKIVNSASMTHYFIHPSSVQGLWNYRLGFRYWGTCHYTTSEILSHFSIRSLQMSVGQTMQQRPANTAYCKASKFSVLRRQNGADLTVNTRSWPPLKSARA